MYVDLIIVISRPHIATYIVHDILYILISHFISFSLALLISARYQRSMYVLAPNMSKLLVLMF